MRLVAYTDTDVRGGAEQMLRTLVAHLDPAIEVHLLGVDRGVLDWIGELRPSVPVHIVPAVANKADLRGIVAHIRAVRKLRPDVVHVNLGTPWHGQYAQLAARLCRGTKVVAVEHTPLASTDRAQRWWKRRLSRRLDAHVAVGAWLARELERLTGLAPGVVRVIHNGIEPDLPPPARDLPEGLTIGSVGRLWPDKGFDLLIRSMAEIPEASGVLVGTGADAGRLQALVDELGLGDRVRLTGWVEDALSYVVGFDILALPSFTEGFPLVTLEAMLAGNGVVASDVGGVAEAVVDGQTGLLVRPRDQEGLTAALRRLVEDPGLRQQLGRAGQALVRERFTAPTMARAYEALYAEVCAR